MKRRAVLERASVAGVLGLPLAGGCLDAGGAGSDGNGDGGDIDGTDTETTDGDHDGDGTGNGGQEGKRVEWRTDVPGRVEAVVRGRVFGLEDFAAEGVDGGVFALDAETGEREWTYGETGGYSAYTSPTVDDAVYFGLGDDAIGSGSGETYAIEFDGAERWTRDTGSVYESPRVVDGVVYVGGDDGLVRAFDAADGDERWRRDVSASADVPSDPDVAAVDDAVYVAAGRLLALERDDGSVRWTYGDADDRIRSATVVDGVAYVATRDGVAAVSGGEERWSTEFESNRWIQGVDAGRVVVEHRDDVHALDAADGEERWVLSGLEGPRTAVHGERVYVGDDRLRALETAEGNEVWSRDVGSDGPVDSLTVVEADGADGVDDDHVLFAEIGDDRLSRFDPDGEETWTARVDGKIRNVLVDGLVYVGTTAGVRAFDPASA